MAWRFTFFWGQHAWYGIYSVIVAVRLYYTLVDVVKMKTFLHLGVVVYAWTN